MIIDDIAGSIDEQSQEMLQLLTVRSHHEEISLSLVLHNLSHQRKCVRTLALNCTYYVIYRVVRDSSFLITLDILIYPGEPKFLLSVHNQFKNIPFGYILQGLNQNKFDDLRVVTDVFNSKVNVYLPVNSKSVR